jgi:TPR repeat protein
MSDHFTLDDDFEEKSFLNKTDDAFMFTDPMVRYKNHKDLGRTSALGHIRKEAEIGHSGAQFCLGLMYYLGEGIQKDQEKALLWIKRAAEKELPEALFSLGIIYRDGAMETRDLHLSHGYFMKAAERGIIEDPENYKGFTWENSRDLLRVQEFGYAVVRLTKAHSFFGHQA